MTDSTDVYDAIVAADRVFETTFASGDAAALASLYTEDAQFMPPNSDFVVGRKAIQATFRAFMDMGIKSITLETLEVESFGDTASEVGRYRLESADGQVLDEGKFFVLWKRVGDQWLLYRDMINTCLPPKG
ncbi:MAG: SgcJ/EcaC family oxidoreductase [Phycisphaera sp.]|nr:SgcJ/EcaC family oxidoreductase [Phycisphaera sp.]